VVGIDGDRYEISFHGLLEPREGRRDNVLAVGLKTYMNTEDFPGIDVPPCVWFTADDDTEIFVNRIGAADRQAV
jgi:hypothetical protein